MIGVEVPLTVITGFTLLAFARSVSDVAPAPCASVPVVPPSKVSALIAGAAPFRLMVPAPRFAPMVAVSFRLSAPSMPGSAAFVWPPLKARPFVVQSPVVAAALVAPHEPLPALAHTP